MSLSKEKHNIKIYLFDKKPKVIMGYEFFGLEEKVIDILQNAIPLSLDEAQKNQVEDYIVLNLDLKQFIGGSFDLGTKKMNKILAAIELYAQGKNGDGRHLMIKLTPVDEFLDRSKEEVEEAISDEEYLQEYADEEVKRLNEELKVKNIQTFTGELEEAHEEEDFEKAIKLKERLDKGQNKQFGE